MPGITIATLDRMNRRLRARRLASTSNIDRQAVCRLAALAVLLLLGGCGQERNKNALDGERVDSGSPDVTSIDDSGSSSDRSAYETEGGDANPPAVDCGSGLAAEDLSGVCRARPMPTMGALEATQ